MLQIVWTHRCIIGIKRKMISCVSVNTQNIQSPACRRTPGPGSENLWASILYRIQCHQCAYGPFLRFCWQAVICIHGGAAAVCQAAWWHLQWIWCFSMTVRRQWRRDQSACDTSLHVRQQDHSKGRKTVLQQLVCHVIIEHFDGRSEPHFKVCGLWYWESSSRKPHGWGRVELVLILTLHWLLWALLMGL